MRAAAGFGSVLQAQVGHSLPPPPTPLSPSSIHLFPLCTLLASSLPCLLAPFFALSPPPLLAYSSRSLSRFHISTYLSPFPARPSSLLPFFLPSPFPLPPSPPPFLVPSRLPTPSSLVPLYLPFTPSLSLPRLFPLLPPSPTFFLTTTPMFHPWPYLTTRVSCRCAGGHSNYVAFRNAMAR
jgi:hypothetical protein